MNTQLKKNKLQLSFHPEPKSWEPPQTKTKKERQNEILLRMIKEFTLHDQPEGGYLNPAKLEEINVENEDIFGRISSPIKNPNITREAIEMLSMQHLGTPVKQIYKNILDIAGMTDKVETLNNKIVLDRYNLLKDEQNQRKLEKFLEKRPEAPELTDEPVTRHVDTIEKDITKIDELEKEHKIFGEISNLEDEQIKNLLTNKSSRAIALALVYSQEMQNFDGLDNTTLTTSRVTLPIVKMADRTIRFLQQVGPVSSTHLELNPYRTDVLKPISIIFKETGFITNDTMWDIELCDEPNIQCTKNLLIRYILTTKCYDDDIWGGIKYLGIYTPTMNKAYRIAISELNEETTRRITKDYKLNKAKKIEK